MKLAHATLFCFLVMLALAPATAADVNVRLSSDEGYVGAPLVLQLDISDARDLVLPQSPTIDGVEVQSAGTPSRSSQITIVNGRRSESQSISVQYRLTPMREGTFEVPPLIVKVDGREVTTRALSFVASKSETGDLLFVEVEGKQSKVYVGEPLELSLKIWIKPFRSSEYRVELNEENMWQMVSENSSWGSFSDRMRELGQNRQRPGGEEVLRRGEDDALSRYFVYEIEATIYPTHAGKIDAGDVRVVVNYPVALENRSGRRGPMLDDAFGNSPLSQMLGDDFFRSAFGPSLVITQSRPLVAGAEVDATEVLPVPTAGRPADYRGTVGKYEIFTQIDNAEVKAGDPIQMDIGITGTGPMKLVQAPPLAEIQSLTRDFKVTDQPLAGFVRGNTKLFTTTIRPRQEGIIEIPAIPLSFFNPETESFETVMSEPIPIKVGKADALSLDAIVTSTGPREQRTALAPLAPTQPNLVNDDSAAVLVHQSPPRRSRWWWPLVVAPPIAWLLIAAVVFGRRGMHRLPNFRSAAQRCAKAVESAKSGDELVQALVRYAGGRTDDSAAAVGSLRLEGLYPQAADLESFIHRVHKQSDAPVDSATMPAWRAEATELMQRIETTRSARRRTLVTSSIRSSTMSKAGRGGIVLVLCGTFYTPSLRAAEALVTLDAGQQQALLVEAHQVYAAATQQRESEPARAKELFSAAATKYEQLVDAGVHNSRLYANLGNAHLQSGALGRAIANYERAKVLDPANRELATKLRFARGRLPAESESASEETIISVVGVKELAMLSYVPAVWILVVASLVFWGAAIIRTLGKPFPFWRVATLPLVLLVITAGMLGWLTLASNVADRGIVVAERLTLRSGDGETFSTTATIEKAEGLSVEVLAERGGWLRVRTQTSDEGWTQRRAIERVNVSTEI